MKEFYKNFFLNMNEEEENSKNYDNIIKLLEEMQNRRQKPDINSIQANSESNFDTKVLEYDKFENPFLYKRNFRHGNLNQLFVSSDSDTQPFFSTDTQLEFLGSLRIWQVAAILIAFVMFMALVIFLFRKLSKSYTRYSPSVLVASSNLENLRGCSVSSYSSDSTNHLLSKNFSMKPSLNYDKNNFGNLRKQLADFV